MSKIEKIVIEFINQKDQRLSDVGDWLYEDDGKILKIRVSRLSTEQREICVAMHELIEVALCRQTGITQEQADDYDKSEPDIRAACDESKMTDSPYYKQHAKALDIERILCHFFGDDWVEYEKELNSL